MKIGIITYHRAHNYGALLQLYSLKSHLSQNNNEVEIIDYWPKYHSDEYSIFSRFSELLFKTKVKRVLFFIFDFYRILKRRNGYLGFIKNNLGLSKSVKFVTKESINNQNFEVVIYGSDQIWRRHNLPQFKEFDDVYFGNYPLHAIKKITYAASMGEINLNEADKSFIATSLKNFDTISVRELSLKNEIKELVNKQISLVLDPVFLLSKNKWIELLQLPVKRDKYVFLYQLLRSDDSLLLTKKAADYYSCEVVEIPGTSVDPLLWAKRYNQTASPIEFLTQIKNAEFVVSTSFHGVAFSIIFEKQFYALGMGNNSGRVQDLLTSLNLQDRYIQNVEDADFTNFIDYKNVNEMLHPLKENSIQFLKEAISL
ncbi:MAG: polysaccharide pyruvyl transferase family protein [Bacteroidota bacterium]